MIKNFIKAWDKNKNKLEEKYNKKYPSYYDDIVKDVVRVVINPYLYDIEETTLKLEKMVVIDDGDYQGTSIYIMPLETYQPSPSDYYFTCVDYGSCSQCDTFEAVLEAKTKKEKVDGFMMIALHIIQSFKRLVGEDE